MVIASYIHIKIIKERYKECLKHHESSLQKSELLQI